MWSLYLLVCPIDKIVRYVGITTTTPEQRLKQHLRDKFSDNPYKFCWLQKLKKENLKPKVVTVSSNLTETQACAAEIELIRLYRFLVGGKLTNILDGGNLPPKICGVDHWTHKDPEKKRLLIEKTRKYWATEENKIKHSALLKGIKKSNTKNIKLAAKRRFSDPAEREKISKIRIERGIAKGESNPMFGKDRPEVGEKNRLLKSKKVAKILNGVIVESYSSCAEAAKMNNLDRGNISKCCYSNKRAGGFHWKFV